MGVSDRNNMTHSSSLYGARYLCALLLSFPMWSGCAAFRPLDGIPARFMPENLKGESRSGKATIDPSLLSRPAPVNNEYRVEAGDVLGVYIESVLGRREEPPPVYFPPEGDAPPSLGYPVPIRNDGTLSLPLLPKPLQVRGLTVAEVEQKVIHAYTVDKKHLNPANARILVSLQVPRKYRILVIRQEAGNAPGGGGGGINFGSSRHGTGEIVSLPAYENDVLHALAGSQGGLPSLDAENAVYVVRRKKSGAGQPTPLLSNPGPGEVSPTRLMLPPSPGVTRASHSAATPRIHQASHGQTSYGHSALSPSIVPRSIGVPTNPGCQSCQTIADLPASFPMHLLARNGATIENSQVIKIPIRLGPNERPQFSPKDVILESGDIVFIESRDTEIFYTAGLLGGGQFTLPRDYDIDVLDAIAIAQGRTVGSGGGGSGISGGLGGYSALNQDVTISASSVVILRRMENGTQLPIKVDLYRAMREPKERVVIVPGDYVVLQYKPLEAVAAFFERHILQSAVFGIAAAQFNNN